MIVRILLELFELLELLPIYNNTVTHLQHRCHASTTILSPICNNTVQWAYVCYMHIKYMPLKTFICYICVCKGYAYEHVYMRVYKVYAHQDVYMRACRR